MIEFCCICWQAEIPPKTSNTAMSIVRESGRWAAPINSTDFMLAPLLMRRRNLLLDVNPEATTVEFSRNAPYLSSRRRPHCPRGANGRCPAGSWRRLQSRARLRERQRQTLRFLRAAYVFPNIPALASSVTLR
jgi:hypothetical protein